VEDDQVLVHGLVRAAGEEHRQPHPPALELALVPQGRARKSGDRDRGRSLPRRIERGGGPALVVVLEEPDQASLVRDVRFEVTPNRLRAGVEQPVVEPLVITVVEPELLEVPLEVPEASAMNTNSGWTARTASITSRQYSESGGDPTRSPQVRENTSFRSSIAMSHRTPSAWRPMSTSVSTAAVRSSSEKALSWATSVQGGKNGSRPCAITASPTAM
jgi:hypothetical protein